jgi:cytochrome c peroxidase
MRKNIHLIKIAIVLSFLVLYVAFSGKYFTGTTVVEGQTGLAAPTGVTASDNVYSNKVGLYWDTIRGATNYRIFRNTVNNSATASDVGVTQANSFLDTTATPGTQFFYWVRAENGAVSSDMSTPDQGTRANGQQQGPVPPLEAPPVPPGNPITATKAYLGKVLFWDEQLSSTRTVSCGTCHHSASGGTDPRSRSVALQSQTNAGPDTLFGTADDIRGSAGVPLNNADGTYSKSPIYGINDQVTGRRSVSYVNAAYFPVLFWDGRALNQFRDPITNAIILNNGGALESQAAGPPTSDAEMGHTGRNWNDVASRVAASKPLALSPTVPAPLTTWINGRTYPELFQEAFGTSDVTPSRIIMAIATFERTLYSDRAPVDLDAAGIQNLTQQENRGRGVFNASSCNVCHAGPVFSDNTFRYIGVRPANEDTGRFQVTGNNQDIGSFRVPSLRNVELRGSYFHNGRFSTLEEVVAFYNRGGDFNAPNKPPLIRPLGLGPQQQADLVAFLKRPLTDTRVTNETERFDRPVLYMESNRVPQITGTGVAGSGGLIPAVRAISPPIVGNPNFTVTVANALGNAPAVLVINDTDPGTGTAPATGSFARVAINLANTGSGNGFGSVSLSVPDNGSLVGRTFTGRWYVSDPAAANGTAVSQAFRFTVFGEASAVASAKFVDFDGDRKTDISVFRPSDGNWYISNSSDNAFVGVHFGLGTDELVPGDYDGDGRTDVAVFRAGTWYLQRSRDGFTAIPFGTAGDLPQVGDFDGDGKVDEAVYRPSDATWYINQSRDGFRAARFGIAADRPVAGDYDGDGKTDIAVYRNDGWWYMLLSTGGFTGWPFGIAEDHPVQGDYDGDGKTDTAVFRPSTGSWYYLKSSDLSFGTINFGLGTDAPTPGDYDGDGKNDFAVFRPSEGNWYILQSASGALRGQHFGSTEDRPVPNAFVR